MIVKKHLNNSFHLFNIYGNSDIYLKIKRPIVISENLRTPENIGAVLRVASNLGAEKVYLINELFHHFKEKKYPELPQEQLKK